MFADKIFQLYDYQTKIVQASGKKNSIFSHLINRELTYGARMMLDDMFYSISTSRIVDSSTLQSSLKFQKTDASLSELKDNIDKAISIAEQVIDAEI